MDVSILARALHVLGVVVWIGGVAMVTSVALPALRAGELGPNWLDAFEAIERRFVWQARRQIIVVQCLHGQGVERQISRILDHAQMLRYLL